jgi:hypothetical protein
LEALSDSRGVCTAAPRDVEASDRDAEAALTRPDETEPRLASSRWRQRERPPSPTTHPGKAPNGDLAQHDGAHVEASSAGPGGAGDEALLAGTQRLRPHGEAHGGTDPAEAQLATSARGGPRPRCLYSWRRRRPARAWRSAPAKLSATGRFPAASQTGVARTPPPRRGRASGVDEALGLPLPNPPSSGRGRRAGTWSLTALGLANSSVWRRPPRRILR